VPQPSGAFSAFAYTIQPGLDTPNAHHASAGVDRELGRDLTASAHAVFVRGFNHVGNIDYPTAVPSRRGASSPPGASRGTAG